MAGRMEQERITEKARDLNAGYWTALEPKRREPHHEAIYPAYAPTGSATWVGTVEWRTFRSALAIIR